jgi:hypothetical protein
MIDTTQVLERIEQAEHETPTCPCGATTIPVDRDGAVWLVCSSLKSWESRRTFRLLSALYPHVNRRVVEASSAVVAA